MENCVFCKISSHEIPTAAVYEDDNYIAFKDIHPKAPNHVLIIPKKHIESFHKVDSSDQELVKGLQNVAWTIIKNNGWQGCQLHMNSGAEHGQEVMHIHLHLLNGDINQVNW